MTEDYDESQRQERAADKARIAELEAAIRAITYMSSNGKIAPSFQPWVDLSEVAPVLRTIHSAKT
jgi:hypothetical protein